MTGMKANSSGVSECAGGATGTGARVLPSGRETARVFVVMTGLSLIAAVAWAWLLIPLNRMEDMGAICGGGSGFAWASAHVATTVIMWMAMSVAMMTPVAAPSVLRVAGCAACGTGRAILETAKFGTAYFAGWLGFTGAMAMVQCTLEAQNLLSPAIALKSSVAGGTLLCAVGLFELFALYSWPGSPRLSESHGGAAGPAGIHRGARLRQGFAEGVACVAKCGPLMTIGFAFGAMNPTWMFLMAIYSTTEAGLCHMGPRMSESALRCVVAGGLVFLGTGLALGGTPSMTLF